MLGADASGGIGALGASDLGVVLMRLQYESAIHDADIFGAIRINLEFMVASSKGIFLNTPLGVVEFRVIEFVRPYKFPIIRQR